MRNLSEICQGLFGAKKSFCFWTYLDETHFLSPSSTSLLHQARPHGFQWNAIFARPWYLLSNLALHWRNKLARKTKITYTHWRFFSFSMSCLPRRPRPLWHARKQHLWPSQCTLVFCKLTTNWTGRKMQLGLGVPKTVQASSTLGTIFFGMLPPLVQKGNHGHVMLSFACFVFWAASPPPPEAAI